MQRKAKVFILLSFMSNSKIPLSNKPLAFSLQMMKPFAGSIITTLVLFGIGTASFRLWFYITKLLIDGLPDLKNLDWHSPWMKWFSLWVFLLLFGNALWRVGEYILAFVDAKIIQKTQFTLFDYASANSFGYFSNQPAGKLGQKIHNAVTALIDGVEYSFYFFFPLIIGVVTAGYLSFLVQTKVGILYIIWSLIHYPVLIFLAYRVSQKYELHADSDSVVSGKTIDSITNFFTVKTFASALFERNYLGKSLDIELKQFTDAYISSIWLWVYVNISIIIMIAMMMWYTFAGYIEHTISLGSVVLAFTVATNIQYMNLDLTMILNLFFRNYGNLQDALKTIVVPYSLEDAADAKDLKTEPLEIAFKDVTFTYPNGRTVFEHLNIKINKGERVGLVGRSGSGKSTFVNLILRFYDVDEGAVVLNDQNVRSLRQNSLRSNISVVPQDTSLFHRTLRENITYGKPEASDEEMLKASQLAHCHEFISLLPEQYESLVGERGVKLSGGQRQRIAMARAILKDAPLLILDEATSSLDSESEQAIQKALENMIENKTVLVIAHRLSTIMHLDRILVFDHGKIVEDGSHQELLKANGVYNHLWQLQSNGFLPE